MRTISRIRSTLSRVKGDGAGATPSTRSNRRWRLLFQFLAFCCLARPELIPAASISVPNASFELPATPFVDPRIDSWQKSPKPDWYDESGGFLWDQLGGVFLNVAPTNSAYIDNVHGSQGLYLFNLPQFAVFQDYSSTDWSGGTPTHGFDARFEPGNSYDLTLGVIGGGGGMTDGATLDASLYYRDLASNKVTVAATKITFTMAAFPTTTHYLDYTVHVPVVQASDPWAGQNIGLQFAAVMLPDVPSGGYWDLDNVRLASTVVGSSSLLSPTWTNGTFSFTMAGPVGVRYQVLATSDIVAPAAQWTLIGNVTNVTGAALFTESLTNSMSRFYQVRQAPQ